MEGGFAQKHLDAVIAAATRAAHDCEVTSTELERLIEIGLGLPYREIAEMHGISEQTVKDQAHAALHKLGLSSRHEVEHALTAAIRRAQAGASEDEIYTYLCDRFS